MPVYLLATDCMMIVTMIAAMTNDDKDADIRSLPQHLFINPLSEAQMLNVSLPLTDRMY